MFVQLAAGAQITLDPTLVYVFVVPDISFLPRIIHAVVGNLIIFDAEA